MNSTMHFSFIHPFKLDLRSEEPPTVVVHAHESNTSEGGEFLNDALRMEDLVLTPGEESVAVGSPYNLL